MSFVSTNWQKLLQSQPIKRKQADGKPAAKAATSFSRKKPRLEAGSAAAPSSTSNQAVRAAAAISKPASPSVEVAHNKAVLNAQHSAAANGGISGSQSAKIAKGHKPSSASRPSAGAASATSTAAKSSSVTASSARSTASADTGGKQPVLTAFLAMDCEMVGVGPNGVASALARVSLLNYHGEVVYDKFVKPIEPVTDYRTAVSGIRPRDLEGSNAVDFKQAQREVAVLLQNRVLVGHSLDNDLRALFLSHPSKHLRDTAYCKILCPAKPKKLRDLVKERLGITIQHGEHSSVEDARSVLALYKQVRLEWERHLHNPKKHPIKASRHSANSAFSAPSAAANGLVSHDASETSDSMNTTIIAPQSQQQKDEQLSDQAHAMRAAAAAVASRPGSKKRKGGLGVADATVMDGAEAGPVNGAKKARVVAAGVRIHPKSGKPIVEASDDEDL